MTRSVIGLPLRLARRGAGLAVNATVGVAEHGLSVAARVADSLLKRDEPDLDFDGAEHNPDVKPERDRPEPPSPPPAAPSPPPAAPPPAVPDAPVSEEQPRHVSTEPTLVEEVAEAGAEDGAGAQVHIDEPWEGYRQMTAGDVVDRITGADSAVLAAVQLYELTARRRQTVLEAVQRELARAGSGQ